MTKKKSKLDVKKIVFAVLLLVLILLLAGIAIWQFTKGKNGSKTQEVSKTQDTQPTKSPAEIKAEQKQTLLTEAESLATTFDYDTAMSKMDEAIALDAADTTLPAKKAEYEEEKSKLVVYKGEIPQVFFHELIVDTKRVFGPKNGDPGGHNSVMTTLKEFKRMMKQMYKKGYILITFHDLYDVTTDDQGKKTFTEKELLLPKGKKPFIMSQDDVACYQKTRIAIGGYSSKYVIDESGKVKTVYEEKDGTKKIGDYDLLPALETFVEKHPDFSYKGARAYIGLTGFDGALGYRVNHENKNKAEFASEQDGLRKVAEAAKAEGFLFASHSYAHGNQESESISQLKSDCKKWKKEIESLVGDVDTYILPKGNWWFKKSGWTLTGDETMSRMNLFAKYGFDFICGVGCDCYRMKFKNFVFMDRYNFDGYAMHNCPDKLSKFFDVDSVWDSGRPGFKGLG